MKDIIDELPEWDTLIFFKLKNGMVFKGFMHDGHYYAHRHIYEQDEIVSWEYPTKDNWDN